VASAMPSLPGDSLPLSLWVALTVLTVIGTAWPSIHEMFLTVIPSRRKYAREKMELELEKLRYEVEGLRRDQDATGHVKLVPLSERVGLRLLPDSDPPSESIASSGRKLKARWRFFFGFLGGLSVCVLGGLLETAVRAFVKGEASLDSVTAGGMLGLPVGVMSGLWTLLVTRRSSRLRTCFLAGAFGVLLVFTIYSAWR
jgi:hypothetical protein